MSFTGLILRNRHAVWAIVIATVILGLVAYREIPVRLFPDTAPPLVNVVTSWPGATASDIDRELTDPLETEFAALEGVASTRSTSQDNVSVIQIEFHYGTEVRLAAVDVDNAVSRIAAELPEGADPPRVLTFSTADRPIYTVGISAEDLLTARRLSEDIIGPRIQSIDGIAAVDVFGGRIPTVLVEVDPAAAEAHHVALPQIAATIRSTNLSAPAGRIRTAESETMLRVDQRANKLRSLEDRVISLPDGAQLRLGSLAKIRSDASEDDAWFSIDGERAIAVQVYRSEDANTVAVVAEIRSVVEELEAEFPQLRFIPGEESASFTEQSVSNLLNNVWQALALASLILFLFLGRARAAMVTAFTMPLAFGLTFALMWAAGMEFNMVTLSAVILAVGMVVDASVVVLENILRLRDEGLDPIEAAERGTDEVRLPVLAGVATTVVVLVPLLSLPGFVGRVFGPLATTLLIAFSSSVLVALVMVPILSLQIRDEGRLEAVAATISRPFQRAMDATRGGYLVLLSFGLRWRKLVLSAALLSFGLGLVGLQSAGMDLLPRMDGGRFTISIQTPSGSSLQRTTTALAAIGEVLEDQPEVVLVQSQAGFEPGMKFAGGSGVMGPTQGFISVTLSPRTERERSIWEIEDAVRAGIAQVPDIAEVVVKEVGNTAKPTTLAPIVARVSGPDPWVLDTLADEVVHRLDAVDSLVQPTRTWNRDMERSLIQVDEAQAASWGQSPLSLARHLAMGAEGIDAGTWSPPLRSPEPIEVRFARPNGANVDTHLSWPMATPGGEMIPARAFAQPKIVIEQGLFTSVDLEPVLDVTAQIDGRPLSFVVADATESLADMDLPQGYRVRIEGENKDLMESRSSILRALGVSVLAVYLLLVAQFRSWIHPLTVMMAVPLSLAGVSLALWLTGKAVSMPVMVGLVLLVGTVVNNSILLIDVIAKRREEGVDPREAILEGVSSRFRPIMMTSLSTVIGMLPLAMELALGAERFSPLATAVIGGLLASTLLTMVVIPVLYDVADGLNLRWGWGRAAAVGAMLLALLIAPVAPAQTTLDQAWALTLEHPAALSADLQVDAAQARKQAATGRLLPQVELSASATRRDPFEAPIFALPIQLPDGTPAEPLQLGDSWNQRTALSATLSQPIFAGGALHQGRRAASAAERMSAAGQQATRSELWLNLVDAWYGLSVATRSVEIQAEVVASARSREASLKRQVEQGRAVQLQLTQVSLKRASSEMALVEAQSRESAARDGLASLLGRSVTPTPSDPIRDALDGLGAETPTGTAPRVAEAEARAEVARAKGAAATGKLLPSVAIRASALYANPDLTQFPVKKQWGSYWDAAVVLHWTLDGGVGLNEARSARLDAKAAEQGSLALARRTETQLARSRAATELAPTRLELAAERVELSELAVQAAERALDAGRITPTELLDREADRAMARAAQLQVAYEVVVERESARALAGTVGPR